MPFVARDWFRAQGPGEQHSRVSGTYEALAGRRSGQGAERIASGGGGAVTTGLTKAVTAKLTNATTKTR